MASMVQMRAERRFSRALSTFLHAVFWARMAPIAISKGLSAGHQWRGPCAALRRLKTAMRSSVEGERFLKGGAFVRCGFSRRLGDIYCQKRRAVASERAARGPAPRRRMGGSMAGWVERFDRAVRASGSLVCVGLDPDPARMPVRDAGEFGRAIVDATRDVVCAYKPQLAYYEALGMEGMRALEATVRHIRDVAPGVVIVGDAKRGDIGPTALAYAAAMFERWDFDAVTVHAYLGRDSLAPFVEREDRGALVVCRTSNPGARDLQDLHVSDGSGSVPLYRRVAALAEECNGLGNVGLVVGATYPTELEELRGAHPRMPFLVPGVGAQGGDAATAARLGTDERGERCMIASSRGIIYASEDRASFASAAREAAAALRDEIAAALNDAGR